MRTLHLFFMLFSIASFSQEKMATRGLEIYNKTECVQFFVIEWVDNCQCDFSLGSGGVGQPCSNHPLTYTYIEYDEDCKPRCKTLATWYPAKNCEDIATLTYTNL